MIKKVSLVACVLLLSSGCSVNKYCLDQQDYQSASGVPPLASAEGLKLPESATALRIPPPPAKAVPFGENYTDEKGDERTRCLDLPPPMPPVAIPDVPPVAVPPTETKS